MTQWRAAETGMRPLAAADITRFWSKVDMSAGLFECWPWIGWAQPKGYGRFSVGGPPGGQYNATRVALTLKLRRDLAPDEMALHHCDNPPCVNPAHLYAGSYADNMRDMLERGHRPPQMRPRTHCHKGLHELTPENVHVSRQGARGCRICRRERQARYIRPSRRGGL